MTNNETVWTDWLKNPGTGECPVPEWAEGLRIAFGDGSDGEYGIPATRWHWGHDLGPCGRITHYRYSIPADLAWLAENAQVWRHRMKLVRKAGGCVEFFQPEHFPGREGYNKHQWLRTRQDFGWRDTHPVTEEEEEAWRERVEAQEAERMKHIVLNGNDGDHYAEVSDGSTASREWASVPAVDQDTYDATAPDILNAALGHMQDRAATYDKPQGERSMKATVDAMQDVTGVAMTEEQGWLFMALLKAVRSQQGSLRMDSYEDGAAYFGLAGEAAAKERGQ